MGAWLIARPPCRGVPRGARAGAGASWVVRPVRSWVTGRQVCRNRRVQACSQGQSRGRCTVTRLAEDATRGGHLDEGAADGRGARLAGPAGLGGVGGVALGEGHGSAGEVERDDGQHEPGRDQRRRRPQGHRGAAAGGHRPPAAGATRPSSVASTRAAAATSATTSPRSTSRRWSSTATPMRSCRSRPPASAPPSRSRQHAGVRAGRAPRLQREPRREFNPPSWSSWPADTGVLTLRRRAEVRGYVRRRGMHTSPLGSVCLKSSRLLGRHGRRSSYCVRVPILGPQLLRRCE